MATKKAVWQGFVKSPETGKPVSGAEVRVFDADSGEAVTLYGDRDGAAGPGNPFFTGSDGFAQFYVDPARIRIEAYDGGLAAQFDDVLAGLLDDGSVTRDKVSSDIVTQVANVIELLSLGESEDDGTQIAIRGYHPDSDVGGGFVYWDADLPRSNHNGGTIISPTSTWDGTQSDLADFLDGTNETNVSANGCWVRIIDGAIEPLQFGALGDGAADDRYSFIGCISVAKSNDIPVIVVKGSYLISGAAIDIDGISFICDQDAVFINTDGGFVFTISGKGISAFNNSTPLIKSGMSRVSFKNYDLYSYNTSTQNDEPGFTAVKNFNAYVNGEFTGGTSGVSAIKSFMEYGRETATSGAGGFLVGNWQIYNLNATTPSGATTEITPISVGANFRYKDPSTGDIVQNNGRVNMYNDFVMHGPVGSTGPEREAYLSGGVFAVNKYAPGTFLSPELQGSDGISVMTSPVMGGFAGLDDKDTLDTYPLRHGIHVSGWSGPIGNSYVNGGHETYATDAFDTGITIGGLGAGVWAQSADTQRSKLFNGMRIEDFRNSAIVIDNAHPDKNTSPVIVVRGGSIAASFGGSIRPDGDSQGSCGTASFRWSEVFAANGTINTSDEREKTEIQELSETEKMVAKELKGMVRKFKWRDAVEEKGASARWHFGVIAQEVRDVFEKHGLDGFEYGLLCYDEWEYEPETYNPDGTLATKEKPAGDRYGVRYDELLAFIISAI